jgi:hypothetical protein
MPKAIGSPTIFRGNETGITLNIHVITYNKISERHIQMNLPRIFDIVYFSDNLSVYNTIELGCICKY